MGKPIRIVQMAKDLIRLSGLEPEVDIPIVFTGLRPGEKLYEELKLLNEQKLSTSHKKIMILKDKNPPIPWSIFNQSLEALIVSAERLESEKIQELLKQILPNYIANSFSPLPKDEISLPKTLIKAEA